MDTSVTYLNSAGQAFVHFTLPMLIQVSILIVILLGLDWILRKRVKAVIRYGIWMLVLVKLLLPPSLTSPTGIGYWVGDKLPEMPSVKSSEVDSSEVTMPLLETNEISKPVTNLDSPPIEAPPILDNTTSPIVSISPSVPTDTNPTLPEQTITKTETTPTTTTISTTPAAPVTPPTTIETTTRITWQAVIFLVWLVVVFSLALLLLQRIFFVRSLIVQSENAPGKTMDILQRCRNQMNIKRNVILKLSPNTTSPSVCGLFRPVILFPRNLADRLDSKQLQSVFLHELAHIKRWDLWISMLQTVLQIIYFYNPLLWLANWRIRRLREQAVDETVLAAMGDQAEQYPNTLLDISKQVFARPALSLRLVGVVESKAALKNRIHHIVTRPFPKSAKLGILGFAAIVITALFLLPMAKAEKNPDGLPENIEEIKNSEFVNAPPKGATVGENITERTLYFKLPLEQPAYHWKFLQRDAFLSGKLVFRIIRDDKVNEIVIFENGKISDGWQSMRSDRGPKGNSIYFGFASSAKYPTSSTDKVELVLTVTEDLDGIGRIETGVLPEGVYISKGYFWISSTSNDIAFLRWKDKWALKITGDVGWMSKKSMFVINDNGKMQPLNHGEKKRLYASVGTHRYFLGCYDVSYIEEVAVMDSSDVDSSKGSEKSLRKIRARKGMIEQRVDIVVYANEKKTKTRSESTLFGGPPFLDKPFLRLDHTRKKVFVEQNDWSIENIRKTGSIEQGDWSRDYDIHQFGRVDRKIATNIGVLCHSSEYAKEIKPKENVAIFNNAAGTDEIRLINPSDGSIQYTLRLDKQDWAICHRIQWYHKQPNIVSKSVEYANFIKPVKFKILAEPGDSGYLLPHNIVRRYFDKNGNEEKNETINVVDAAMAEREKDDINLILLTYEKDLKVAIPEDYTIIDNRSADPLIIEPDDNSRRSYIDSLSQEIRFKNISRKPGKINVQVESPGIIVNATGQKNVFLPDADTENTNVILDLATGQLLPAIQGTEKEVQDFYQNIAKGDLAYEDGLICLRGAKISFRTAKNRWTFSPSSIRKGSPFHDLKALPSHLRITTSEGDDFDVHILSKKVNGLQIAYRKSEANAESTQFHLGLTEEYRKYFQNIQPLIERDPQVIKLNQQVEIFESQIDELLFVRTMTAIHPTVQTIIFRLGTVQKKLDQRKLQILQEYKRGQKASNVRVDLPNDITVEYIGFGNIVADKLQWWDPNGQPTHIPNVSEADVEGLGTVLAFRLSSSEPTSYINFNPQKVQGPNIKYLNKRWTLPDSDIWLVCLETEHRFINLRLHTTRRTPWYKSDVIPLTIDQISVEKPIAVNRFGVETIHLGQKWPDALCLSFIRPHKGPALHNFLVLDKSNRKYPGVKYLKAENKVPNGIPFKFDIAPDELVGVAFEYLYETYSKGIFKNLTLIPGKKANPKIEIIK